MSRKYSSTELYPDEDLLAAVMALARWTDEPVDVVLTAFGQAIIPTLLQTYGPFILPTWKSADVLENVERVIHRAVRLQDPGATPPYLTAERVASDEVLLRYTSPRRLCALGKGLVHGVAHNYSETAEISDRACMHRGDRSCVLHVKLAALAT